MARRISGVGLVTVSLRKSTVCTPTFGGAPSIVEFDTLGPYILPPENFIRPSVRQILHWKLRYGSARGATDRRAILQGRVRRANQCAGEASLKQRYCIVLPARRH